MFTGIVTDKGKLFLSEKQLAGISILVGKPTRWRDLVRGESIALNGACMTLEDFDSIQMKFFVSLETVAKTAFQYWKKGSEINLERSLRLGDRLGGHWVSGHIDGTALVTNLNWEGESMDYNCLRVTLKIPQELQKWIVSKGSVCINGVSLTVNSWDSLLGQMELLLIPETLKVTNLKNILEGELVNLECDQIVKVITEKMSLTESLFGKNLTIKEAII